ncbi:class I SAM-dependent methyltransferase [Tistrella sp. BH-R2-4]|uniref:Class I SAM-dependent methyltransferase n=1 Tax=Tistrella arctica TaxID=3133430 RepID=A0ABU9YLU1_9PROT
MTVMTLPALTPEQIDGMCYNELIGLIQETNRPPGGRQTIVEVALHAFLGPHKRVLDIGTSTGVTALELARTTGCHVTGIDINPLSLQVARDRARSMGVDTVTFQEADALDLPFPDGHFDLIFCGNVTSLVRDAGRAIGEYQRVLKPNGLLATVPMYYVDTPSDTLVDEVRAAIQVPITVKYRAEALEPFRATGMEVIHESDWRFARLPRETVDAYCARILQRPHLTSLNAAARAMLERKYRAYMELFRNNLSLMGYTVMMLRKSSFIEDEELFVGERAS